MTILQFVIAALIVEALWETSKMFWQNGKLSIDRVGAVAFGLLIAVGAGMDFMSAIQLPIHIPYVGMIVTGLLISRGSNWIHDLMGKIETLEDGKSQ